MNLNNIAGKALAAAGVHVFEAVRRYACVGQENARGDLTPIYAEPVDLEVQVRTLSDAALSHAGMTGENNTTREIYLNTEDARVQGLSRPQETGGDMALYKGQWWLATANPEDFAVMGWVKMRLTLQIKAPDFSASPWFTQGGQP